MKCMIGMLHAFWAKTSNLWDGHGIGTDQGPYPMSPLHRITSLLQMHCPWRKSVERHWPIDVRPGTLVRPFGGERTSTDNDLVIH